MTDFNKELYSLAAIAVGVGVTPVAVGVGAITALCVKPKHRTATFIGAMVVVAVLTTSREVTRVLEETVPGQKTAAARTGP